MAAVDVPVPDIGEFTDVPVVEVLVSVGDEVEAEAPLIVLETDKASMEVPAPSAGTVDEVKVSVGDTVSEGTVIATLEPAGEDGGGGEEPASSDAGAAAEDDSAGSDAEASAEAEAESEGGDGPIHASPSVRRLARERAIDLATITGSGRGGRIVPEDLDRVGGSASDQAAPAAEDGAGPGLAPWPQVDFEKYGEVERVELSRIRRLGGANLARNWVRIPHVTHHEDADITELEAFRKQLNAEQSDVRVTMVSLLLKASAATLAAFPEFNASLDGEELVLKRYFHLGFAADTPRGLVVPVIRDVDAKGILALAGELTELSGRAREGKLGPGEMAGATFTISSLGGIGGTAFTPIINAPEVAILGVTRSAHKPVWDGERFVPRLVLGLSLSYDHRVIDGAAAARFCAHLAGVLRDMRRVLL
ncbi:MAG: dihydrolipoyllysine-residue acetyltransferase [Solirubrobacteraceae bacterium MAG38_C4-C5]|nr:dihydrolipoyllysine-residue acetyltransferase [Candidatus Siliceabacter maunaloa]